METYTYIAPSISDFAYGIGFSIAVMSVIFRAIVFSKAGQKWWKAPIVVYGDYVLVTLAKAPVAWFWGYALSLSSGVLLTSAGTLSLLGSTLDTVLIAVGSLLLISAFVFLALISDKVAKAFGKPRVFGVGLLLLNPLFYGILAIGSAEYQYSNQDADKGTKATS
jgi:hypothetical protein